MAKGLTAKQRKVCEMISRGYKAREIAAALGIGQRTVEEHREAAYRKLGVNKAVEMVKKMFLEGTLA